MGDTPQLSSLNVAMRVICLLFWLIAYGLIIKRGIQDRTFGMPVVALAANVAFEFLLTFFCPIDAEWKKGTAMWLLIDFGVLYTCLRYGRDDFSSPVIKKWFFPGVAILLVAAGCLEWSFMKAFQDNVGTAVSLGTNLLLSSLYIAMLIRRGSVKGQSFYIAFCILIGNIAGYYVTVYYPTPPPPTPIVLIHTFLPCILLLNVLYSCLVVLQCRKEGINPWVRF